MSASVPISPSELKSALLVQGAAGQLPARQRKKASMSASVPMSPSQLKSALPQGGGLLPTTMWRVGWPGSVVARNWGKLGSEVGSIRRPMKDAPPERRAWTAAVTSKLKETELSAGGW